MTKRSLGVALMALLAAPRVVAQNRWQVTPEQHPRPQPDSIYSKARLDRDLPSYKRTDIPSGRIQGAYQDLNTWITAAWADGFKGIYPNVEFSLNYASPFSSIPALGAGTLQFAAAGRELLDADRDAFRRKQGASYDPLVIAVAGGSYRTMGFTDAFVFFVNKDNPIDKLSLTQLDAMYSTTRKRGYKEDIRTWGQLGLTGEWADKPIILWGVTPPNGYEGFLRERVLEGGTLKDAIETRDTAFALPYLVGFNRHSIGYASLSFLTPCVKSVKQIAIAENDGGPYYRGSFEEVLTQKYPLSRVIYIYIHRIPGQPVDPRLKEFLRFVLSREGQQIVMNDRVFLPLPAWIVKRELAKLE